MLIEHRAIAMGERIPFLYGIAWSNHRAEAACYVIPFNIFARWLRALYWKIARPRSSKIDIAIGKAYAEGFKAGRAAVFDQFERMLDEKARRRKLDPVPNSAIPYIPNTDTVKSDD